jgi:hypothetical protein
MATKAHVEALKHRVSRKLLRLPGVNGVGIERAAGSAKDGEEYALVVHVEDDNPDTRAAVEKHVSDKAVRIVAGGKFKKL